MPRMARVVVPGLPHHVTQRGVRKQQVFFDPGDYLLYLATLTKVCAKVGVDIWAYCLMPNHAHAIAVPHRPDGLAKAFGLAHQLYAVQINAQHGWQGHLWQERFRSTPIDSDEYLLTCTRYVERNPVEARLCRRPEDWPWSSVHAHLADKPDGIVKLTPMRGLVTNWRKFIGEEAEPKAIIKIRPSASPPE